MNNQKTIFFRNDDLGWMPQQFDKMLSIFRKHQLPLCAAAIPLYCQDTYKANHFSSDKDILEVHTHGYSHLDHQSSGKKAEFGAERTVEGVTYDLKKAYAITKSLFPEQFYPAFTPPWNRIEGQFIKLLSGAGFKVLSRDPGKLANVDSIIDLNIDIDIHTSKKGKITDPLKIISAIEQTWSEKDICGVMLHHKHMEDNDFLVLDLLLAEINKRQFKVVKYNDIAPIETQP